MRIMELQQEIAFEKSEAMKGRTLEVMIEGKVADENAYVGRNLYGQPERRRAYLCKHSDFPLMSGDFLRYASLARPEYDLIGEAEDDDLPNKLTILRE